MLCTSPNRSCITDPECNDKLRIVDIRPNVPEGCTFVQWVDSSECAANSINSTNQLTYTIELSQNCSDPQPLQTILVQAYSTKTFTSLNTSQFKFPIYLRVQGSGKGNLNYCQWKSRCHKVDPHGNVDFKSSMYVIIML